MAIPFLVPALAIVGGSVVVSGIWGVASAAKEMGDAAEKSVTFMDRVIVLSIIGGVTYMGAKGLR